MDDHDKNMNVFVSNGENNKTTMTSSPQVFDEHRARFVVNSDDDAHGKDDHQGQVNLGFEGEESSDNRINDNYYNSERHGLQIGADDGPTINIPKDSVINMQAQNGRNNKTNNNKQHKKQSNKEKDVEKIPLEDMDETANVADEHQTTSFDGDQSTNGHKNGLRPVTSDKLDNSNKQSIGKQFKEYFIPVTTHKKFLRGEKLYLQKYTGKSSTWKKCIICGIVATFLAIAIVIAILLAAGLIVLKSADKPMSSRSTNNTDGVQPAAAMDRNVDGVVVPIDATTTWTTTHHDDTHESTTQEISTTEDFLIGDTEPATTSSWFTETSTDPQILTGGENNEVFAETSPRTVPPTGTQRTIDEEDNVASGEIRLTSLQFDDNLKDNSSDEFQNLANSIQSDLNEALAKNNRKIKYIRVVGFSPGSVKVHYVVVYDDGTEEKTDSATEQEALNEYIQRNGGVIAGYSVDPESVKLKAARNECEDNNGFCTHICSWNPGMLDRVCSCPEGLHLDKDGMSCLEGYSTAEPEPTVGYTDESRTESLFPIEFGNDSVLDSGKSEGNYTLTEATTTPTSEPEPNSHAGINETSHEANTVEPISEPEPTAMIPNNATVNNTDVETIAEAEPSADHNATAEPASEHGRSWHIYNNDTTAINETTDDQAPSFGIYDNTTSTMNDSTMETDFRAYLETNAQNETNVTESNVMYDDEAVKPLSVYNDTVASNETEAEPSSEPEPSAGYGNVSSDNETSESTGEPEPMPAHNSTLSNDTIQEPISEPEPSYASGNETSESTGEPEPMPDHNSTLSNDTIQEPVSGPEPSYASGNETFSESTGEPEPEPSYASGNETSESSGEPEPMPDHNSTWSNDTIQEPISEPEPGSGNETGAVSYGEPEPAYNDTMVDDGTLLPTKTLNVGNASFVNATLPEPEPEPVSLYNSTIAVNVTDFEFTNETTVAKPTGDTSGYNVTHSGNETILETSDGHEDFASNETVTEPELAQYNVTGTGNFTVDLHSSGENETEPTSEPESEFSANISMSDNGTDSGYGIHPGLPELHNETIVHNLTSFEEDEIGYGHETVLLNNATHVENNTDIEATVYWNLTEPTSEPEQPNNGTNIENETFDDHVAEKDNGTMNNETSDSEPISFGGSDESNQTKLGNSSISEEMDSTAVGGNGTVSLNGTTAAEIARTNATVDEQVHTCSSAEFKCSKPGLQNVGCVPLNNRCDGLHDCEDGSDEMFCGNCTFGKFPCKDGSNCLSPTQICDTRATCKDKSDERNCVEASVCKSSGGVPCSDGLCLPESLRCDGHVNCPNGEDERSCSCSGEEFRCSSGLCIPWDKKCDGVNDCPDDTDETTCVKVETNLGGLLKIFKPQIGWMSLCISGDWSSEDGNAVCRQLGYSSADKVGSEVLPHDTEWTSKWDSQEFQTRVHTAVLPVPLCESNLAATVHCTSFACDDLQGATPETLWSSLATLKNVEDETKSCQGVILSPFWISTTTSCLDKQEYNEHSSWKVHAGREYDAGGEQIRTAERFVFNPHANKWLTRELFVDFDVALVKVDRPFQFGQHVSAACINEDDLIPTETCYSGAMTVENSVVMTKLNVTDVTKCNGTEHYDGRITDRMICTRQIEDQDSEDVCQDSEGSALMCQAADGRWTFIGQQIHQHLCGRYKRHPVIFSDFRKMSNYLTEIIGELSRNKKASVTTLVHEEEFHNNIDDSAPVTGIPSSTSTQTNDHHVINEVYVFDSDSDETSTTSTQTIDHRIINEVYVFDSDSEETSSTTTTPKPSNLNEVFDGFPHSINTIADFDQDAKETNQTTNVLIDSNGMNLFVNNVTIDGDDVSESSNKSVGLKEIGTKQILPKSNEKRCQDGNYQCEKSRKCIPNNLICNGVDECEDGSDERTCIRIHPEASVFEVRKTGEPLDSLLHPRDLWVPVCADGWTNKYSDAACRQMGYREAKIVEFTSSKDLKESRPEQKFAKLKHDTDLITATNLHQLFEETEQCQSGNYTLLTCEQDRCGSWSLDLQPIGRIAGGNPAQDGQWPSVTMLKSQINESFICTASVLSQKWVMTAASCLERGTLNADKWLFFVGPDEQAINVSRILTNPHKTPGDLVQGDLALVEVEMPNGDDAQVHSICIPSVPLEQRQLCVTASWTTNEVTGELALKYLPVPIVSTAECNSSKHYHGAIADDMICAGYTDRQRATCEGDQGAPLMCINSGELWVLSGVLTRDNVRVDCTQTNFPSVYTSTYKSQSWISDVMSYTWLNS